MERLKISKVKKADLNQIASHYTVGDTPWDPFCSAKRMMDIPKKGFWVARVNGRYAGFLYWFEGGCVWFDKKVKNHAYIQEVQVTEKFRGKGLGKALLQYALADIKKRSIADIYVDTPEDNSVACHLYKSFGFIPARANTVHYKLKS